MSEEMNSAVKLLIATTNSGKLAEMRELLKEVPVELLFLKDLSSWEEVPETGKTFEENARLKAEGYAKQSGLLTIGEDSGLCCEALEGAPGVYSARFAGEGKDDEANNEKLLRIMKPLPDNCRGAHYTSVIALATPEGTLSVFKGEVHGSIHTEAVGAGGFGYDPIFFYKEYNRTFGQVTLEEKHKVSHRGKALAKLLPYLKEYFSRQHSA